MNLQFPELGCQLPFDWDCAMLVRYKHDPANVAVIYRTPAQAGDIRDPVTFLSGGLPTFVTIEYAEKHYEVLRVIPFTDLIISAV